MKIRPYLVVAFFALFVNTALYSQKKDSIVATVDYKNGIRVNVSNLLLYDTSIQLVYERVLSDYRSFTVFGGYQTLPMFLNVEDFSDKTFKDVSKIGFSVGGDYRFYLQSENKYKAPRGLFLGVFTSLFYFQNKKQATMNAFDQLSKNYDLTTEISLVNFGGELGYQFNFGKKRRWTLDAVLFGPSATWYDFRSKIVSDSNIDRSDEQKKILSAMKDNFPFLAQLFGEGISKTGSDAFLAAGFRYAVSVGYRF